MLRIAVRYANQALFFAPPPAEATLDTGRFLVAWGSPGSSGTDNSSASIQAQRYDGLFRDGFESPDTTRWSASVP